MKRPADLVVRKASSVVGLELNSLEAVAERRMMDKMNSILDNPSHPLSDELWQMGSTFSHQLIPPRSGAVQAFTGACCLPDSTTATVTTA